MTQFGSVAVGTLQLACALDSAKHLAYLTLQVVKSRVTQQHISYDMSVYGSFGMEFVRFETVALPAACFLQTSNR